MTRQTRPPAAFIFSTDARGHPHGDAKDSAANANIKSVFMAILLYLSVNQHDSAAPDGQ